MDLLVGLGILFLLAIPLLVAIRRSTVLFVLRVRRGRVELVSGRIPAALLADIEDIFARTTLDGEIRVVAEQRRPRVFVQGLTGAVAQRVRNVVGRFQLAQIRAGKRAPSRAFRRADSR